jgi:hypothetical protein
MSEKHHCVFSHSKHPLVLKHDLNVYQSQKHNRVMGNTVDKGTASGANKNADLSTDQRKVLILGCRGSGKTTVYHQAKLLFGSGFSEEARENYKSVLLENILRFVDLIFQEAKHAPEFSEEAKIAMRNILALVENEEEPKNWLEIKVLCNEPVSKRLLHKSVKYDCGISTNIEFFLDKVEKISSVEYVVSNDDILRSRERM